MKRTIAAILSAAMLVTAAAAAEAPSSWAKSAVDTARNAGIVPEQVDQAYTQSITRADFCALAAAVYRTWEKSGNVKSVDKATVSFSDTKDEDVLLCASLGVVNGVGNGKFAPQQQLTRQQAASMLHRLGNLRKNAKDNVKDRMPHVFADGADIQSWARNDVYWVYNQGVMNGVSGNRFAPNNSYTREQSIATMLRLYDTKYAEVPSKTAAKYTVVVDSDDGFNVQMHLEDAIDFIPYGTMVDEFQHIMYQQPDLTPDERNAVWLELEKKYRPWNKFGDLPFYGRGAGWQRQLHIFECPFYYIDYCLATAIALQFFVASLKDHKDAWQRYMKLTNLAGMATYTELAESAGMKAPFTKGSLTELSRAVADWIEQHQVS